jgi:hypothetical protein
LAKVTLQGNPIDSLIVLFTKEGKVWEGEGILLGRGLMGTVLGLIEGGVERDISIFFSSLKLFNRDPHSNKELIIIESSFPLSVISLNGVES